MVNRVFPAGELQAAELAENSAYSVDRVDPSTVEISMKDFSQLIATASADA